jgi:dGTPase
MYAHATYAMTPALSLGRAFPEADCPLRTPFQRDRDRILHSSSFRRLEYKTQVFMNHEGDHYRNRLTHSLEVAQIARSLARNLGLDEYLTETIALAHDLGHPPFGHAGERALNDAMAAYGGFNHNVHTIKILTKLEERYAQFDGLNLCWETLEGIAKHNGPLTGTIHPLIADLDATLALQLPTHPSLEAQAASLADDIAYVAHDLEDGIRAELFSFDALREVKLVAPWILEVEGLYPDLQPRRKLYEMLRRVTHAVVTDLLTVTRSQLHAHCITSPEQARAAPQAIVQFSPKMLTHIHEAKAFLLEHLYRHPHVIYMTRQAEHILSALFSHYMKNPADLPKHWHGADAPTLEARAELVGDFIAGMTDRFAIKSYENIFGILPA